MNNFVRGVVFTLIGAVFWGASGVMGEHLFKNAYSPEWVSFYRLSCSGIILLLLSLKPKNFQIFTSIHELISLCIFGLFGLMMCQFTYFKAIAYLDAGTATMIQYSAPVIIMIIVCISLRVLPRKNEVFALVLTLFGVFLLATKGNPLDLNLNLTGVLWGIVAAFGIVFYSLSGRAIIKKYGLFCVMGFGSIIGACIFGISIEVWNIRYDLNAELLLMMSGIVFIGTIGAFCFYLKGLEYIGAVKASIVACVEPIAAACFSWLFIGTRYSLLDIFSFILILLSVLLVTKKKDKKASV